MLPLSKGHLCNKDPIVRQNMQKGRYYIRRVGGLYRVKRNMRVTFSSEIFLNGSLFYSVWS